MKWHVMTGNPVELFMLVDWSFVAAMEKIASTQKCGISMFTGIETTGNTIFIRATSGGHFCLYH